MKTTFKIISLGLLLSFASCGGGAKSNTPSIDELMSTTSQAVNSSGGNCDFNLVSDYNLLIIKCSSFSKDAYSCNAQYEAMLPDYPNAKCQAEETSGYGSTKKSEVVTITVEDFKRIRDAGVNRN